MPPRVGARAKLRSMSGLVVVLAGLVACGHAGPEAVACTDIGAPSGVSVDIAPEIAAQVADSAHLMACWGGACKTVSVVLEPSTRSVDQGCTGSKPDDTCSATSVPTGGKQGFGSVDGLPAAPVEVRVTVPGAGSGRGVKGMVTVTPERVYPNGRDCPGAGVQGRVAVNRDGDLVGG
jgi:hypothetical protein